MRYRGVVGRRGWDVPRVVRVCPSRQLFPWYRRSNLDTGVRIVSQVEDLLLLIHKRLLPFYVLRSTYIYTRLTVSLERLAIWMGRYLTPTELFMVKSISHI